MNQKDTEYFIRIWQTANTAIAVGKQLNMSSAAVRSLAVRLRKQGVPLKMFKSSFYDKPTDYLALIALAESYNK